MPEKRINEDMDTLKFKIPKQTVSDYEQTRVYKKSELMSSKQRSQQTAANRQAAAQQTNRKQSSGNPGQAARPSASGQTTHKRRPQQQKTVPQKNTASEATKKQVRKNPFGKFLKTIALIAIALFFVYSAMALSYITKISPIEHTGNYINDPATMLYSSDVKNILIIGEDSRDNVTKGLSDSIILLSINKKNHKLQMTSFMRDIYTQIDGYDNDKINAAYVYGGAELLKDTIEDNFKIRIDNCVTVNFTAVAHIVDAVGGVQITLSDEEAAAVNDILYSEVNEIMGDPRDADFLPGGGTFMLNGKQALSYSRIRYVGNADFERTQRQRTVITQLMSRMKKINILTFNSKIKKAASYIGCDMSVTDMYILSLRLPFLLASYSPEQLRVPADGTWNYDETWDGMSIITVDFYANTEYLKQNIYLVDKAGENIAS